MITNKDIKNHPAFLLISHADELSQEHFDYCVRQEPLIALNNCTDKLTLEQINFCIKMRNYKFGITREEILKRTEVRHPLIEMILYMILILSFLSIFLQAYYN